MKWLLFVDGMLGRILFNDVILSKKIINFLFNSVNECGCTQCESSNSEFVETER